ncbi:efflux RND transporter periplasmic adaptor subunit [Alloalcanivorax sp. C16-2]|uniref:efflux RND transporter periplasmic adaptor subunit n=1 Tax=Alloalcanivorax TaxID=3020832 RepID=UPI001934A2FE|nr:efflux RND transporter periplasmic adaptor subunit [Alloalcanivorax marinus]MBL7251073.1 efflux RND transporter periplasmic adaptor subunit [Alloalcanivorax marinus]
MLRVIASLALVAALVLGAWWWRQEGLEPAAAQRPPTVVNVAPAITRPLANRLDVVGNARASRAVTLLTEVDGRVKDLHFQEGQSVAAGDLLVSLDDRQARADLGRARAEYQRALSDYQRAARLAGSRSISEAEVDTLKTTLEAAKADQAASMAALDDHRIRAPFDGVVGLRQVDPGAYLQVGDPIANLDSILTLDVHFQVPERYLAHLHAGLPVDITSDAYPGKTFHGKVALLDTRVDTASRGLPVKAVLDNSETLLRPGQFLQVSVLLEEHAAVLVPEQAVITQGAQSYVFTVSDTQRAERRAVSLGGRRDGWVEITAGLRDHEPVIVNGHSRLGGGAPVKVVEDQGALLPAQRALLEEAA